MIELKKIVNKIIEDRKLENSKFEKKCNQFYSLEGVNSENGENEAYLVYDCSIENNDFNYEDYTNKLDDYIDSISVIIFKNWDDEMRQYYTAYDKLKKGNQRRFLSNYFEHKLTYYTDIEPILKLYVEDEENYNEYIVKNNYNDINKNIEGYIYNLTLKELKKLFNITGKSLFKENVRNGLKRNPIVEEIKRGFRKYLYSYICSDSNLVNKNIDVVEDIKIEFGIDDETMKYNLPEFFWFCHNGITIFLSDNQIERSGSYISFNPEIVSVINGAQTLTNFYLELETAKRDMITMFEDRPDILKIIKNLLDEAYEKIVVKTIFIKGEKEFVKPVTYGLNKQVPILNEHILANSDEVYELNNLLKKKKIEIVKEGEVSVYGNELKILGFVKKYLIIKEKPGTSKNLRKIELEKYLKEASSEMKEADEDDFYLSAYRFLNKIDEWWKKSKKNRDQLYIEKKEKLINSFGKNYFESFLIYKCKKDRDIFDFDDEYFDIYYNEFLNLFDSYSDFSAKEFKSDKLFEECIGKYVEKTKSSEETTYINNIKNKLITYINGKNNISYNLNSVIAKFLKDENIGLSYFRVVRVLNEKCKEAFPFPNSCFTEISDIYINNKNIINNLDFESSKFYKEINKSFPIFVVEVNDKNVIINIKYFSSFSFKKFNDDAKKVYDKTLEAFDKGDELLFPKSSEGLSFHVRPKAANSNDTFEFSNGNQITKRTFWANKSTVEGLIKNYNIN